MTIAVRKFVALTIAWSSTARTALSAVDCVVLTCERSTTAVVAIPSAASSTSIVWGTALIDVHPGRRAVRPARNRLRGRRSRGRQRVSPAAGRNLSCGYDSHRSSRPMSAAIDLLDGEAAPVESIELGPRQFALRRQGARHTGTAGRVRQIG